MGTSREPVEDKPAPVEDNSEPAEAKPTEEAKSSAKTAKPARARRDAKVNKRACRVNGENAQLLVTTAKNVLPEPANALPAHAKDAVTAIPVAPALMTARVAQAEPPALHARRDNRAKRVRVTVAIHCRAQTVVVPVRRAIHLRTRCGVEQKAWCVKRATRRWPTNASMVNVLAVRAPRVRRVSDVRPEFASALRRAAPVVVARETNANLRLRRPVESTATRVWPATPRCPTAATL